MMASDAERLKILDMVEKGQISAEDAVQLLQAIGEDDEAVPEKDFLTGGSQDLASGGSDVLEPSLKQDRILPDEESVFEGQSEASEFVSEPEILTPNKAFDPSALKWRGFWWIPMWVGVGITIASALLMYGSWNSSGFGFWFACAWFPLALGVMVMALAWASRTARWLHVRVHQKAGQKPERIAISLPIPLRLTAWFLRVFGKNIPGMGETSLDEVIMALDSTSPDAPFYVEVNEGDDGERVEVYIG